MKKMMLTLCSVVLVFSTTNVLANMEEHAPSPTANPMTQEYMAAMDKMHKPMMAGIMASDPDVAFVAGMIPHHQGAIDMAKIELKYGKDPEIRALAEQVIAAQEQEIAFMQKWLEQHQSK